MIADLEGLTIEYPLREPLWVLLFTALCGAGRSSEVRSAFERARALLASGHELEPSAQLGRTARALASDSFDAGGIDAAGFDPSTLDW